MTSKNGNNINLYELTFDLWEKLISDLSKNVNKGFFSDYAESLHSRLLPPPNIKLKSINSRIKNNKMSLSIIKYETASDLFSDKMRPFFYNYEIQLYPNNFLYMIKKKFHNKLTYDEILSFIEINILFTLFQYIRHQELYFQYISAKTKIKKKKIYTDFLLRIKDNFPLDSKLLDGFYLDSLNKSSELGLLSRITIDYYTKFHHRDNLIVKYFSILANIYNSNTDEDYELYNIQLQNILHEIINRSNIVDFNSDEKTFISNLKLTKNSITIKIFHNYIGGLN